MALDRCQAGARGGVPNLLPLADASTQLPAQPEQQQSVAEALRSQPDRCTVEQLAYLVADNINGRTAARRAIGASVGIKRAQQRTGLAVAAHMQQQHMPGLDLKDCQHPDD